MKSKIRHQLLACLLTLSLLASILPLPAQAAARTVPEFPGTVTTLSELGQRVYQAMRNHEDSLILGDVPLDVANDAIHEAVNYDPVYYAAGNFYAYAIRYGVNNVFTTKIGINYRIHPQEAMEARYEKLAAILKEVLSHITPEMTDVEKCIFLHNYLCETVAYAYDITGEPDVAADTGTAYGALTNHRCVCGGYADAYQLLMTVAGIENKYISGTVGEALHAWNLVKLDGNWYHVDVTWDDSRSDLTTYGYRYFLLNDAQMAQYHTWNAKNYPAATDTSYVDFPRGYLGQSQLYADGIFYSCGGSDRIISKYDIKTKQTTTLWDEHSSSNYFYNMNGIALYDNKLYVGSNYAQGSGGIYLIKIDLASGDTTLVDDNEILRKIDGAPQSFYVEDSGILHCIYYDFDAQGNREVTIDLAPQSVPSHTVRYDVNGGGGVIPAQTKTPGEALTLTRLVPYLNGYFFMGWATSSTATAAEYQPNDTYTADADLTLYAVWHRTTFTLTYDATGGEGAPDPQIKTENEEMTLSTVAPTRAGYTFKGWSTSSSSSTPAYQPGDTYDVDKNATLYAVWSQNTYAVTYDANGGTDAPEPQTKKGAQPLTLTSATPTRVGYAFQGWATSPTASTPQYRSGNAYTEDQNVTLYAVWQLATYNIIYNTNHGNNAPATQIKTGGQPLTLSTAIPTRIGCNFQGWATSPAASDPQYRPGDVYTDEQSVTLYAVWQDIPITALGQGDPVNGSITENNCNWYAFTAPLTGTYVFTTTGSTDTYGELYSFTNSNKVASNDDSGERRNFKLSYDMTEDQTVFLLIRGFSPSISGDYTVSVTRRLSTYPVSYRANGGTGAPASQTKTQEQSLTLSSKLPIRRGYTFLGWATSPDATAVQYHSGDAYTADAAVTLYAVWEEIPVVVTPLTLDQAVNDSVSDGSAHWYAFTAPADGTYIFFTTGSIDTYGELYPSVLANKLAYNDNGGQSINFRLSYPMTAGQTLYLKVRGYSSVVAGDYAVAVTQTPDTFTVTYDANGGVSAPDSQVKTEGQSLTLSSAIPTQEGYVFRGWSLHSTNALPVYQPGDLYTQDRDVTLYAIWVPDTAQIPPLTLDQFVSGRVSNGTANWYAFTAPADGTYIFSTTGSTDTYGQLYSVPTEDGLVGDDDSGDGRNFRLSAPMTAGQTLYLRVRGFYVSTAGTYAVGVVQSSQGDDPIADTNTVSYDANGGAAAPASQSVSAGQSLTLSADLPTRAGYIFIGWAETPTAVEPQYLPGDSYTPDASTTLYAIWALPVTEDQTTTTLDQLYSATTQNPDNKPWFLYTAEEDGTYNFTLIPTNDRSVYCDIYAQIDGTLRWETSSAKNPITYQKTMSAGETVFMQAVPYMESTEEVTFLAVVSRQAD